MKSLIRYTTLLFGVFLSNLTFAQNSNYSIYIDAGSSGSRLHIFHQTKTNTSMPVIEEVFSESTKPGLSSYADHPEQAGASLTKLLSDAEVFLNSQNELNKNTTTVNVLATAGMRLLPAEKQAAIYANVAQAIQKYASFSAGAIETIPGKMEGVYGWLDVNYLLGNFQSSQPTVGSLDMGGASTQITYAVDTTTHKNTPSDDTTDIFINNKHYTVFSKSFLGLGEDQARNTMNQDATAANCYPAGYHYTTDKIGQFNLSTCEKLYADVISAKHVSQQIKPIANTKHFVAYSGFYYTFHFLNTDLTPNKNALEMHIQSTCNQTWEQLKQANPNVPEKYLATYCADAVFQDHLLNDTYKINDANLAVLNKINHQPIDWTLGAALYGMMTP